MRTHRSRAAALAALCCARAAAQDPLAGSYSDFSAPPPPPPGAPPQGMAPGGMGGPAPVGGGFGRSVVMLGVGAGAMKAFDFMQARRTASEHERDLHKLKTTIAVKRSETEQYTTQLQQCYSTVRQLQGALYESEQEALARDYEEFKAPDADGDERISLYEFGAYIKNYMKAYPHIPEADYPTFGDFDSNGDGTVTFKEWQAYLQEQKKSEKSSSASKKGYEGLSATADKSQSFQEMYAKLKAAGG